MLYGVLLKRLEKKLKKVLDFLGELAIILNMEQKKQKRKGEEKND